MFRKLILHAAMFFAAFSFLSAQQIKFGDEILLTEYQELIAGKNLGLVTNTSSVLSDGSRFIDKILKAYPENVISVFALEHGFDLRSGAGVIIEDEYLDKIQIHSLYGKTKKPTPQMLKGLDVIVFDVQDIGTRFYTYISSLKYLIEACSENNVELIVCDRPNLLSGLHFDGPILEDEFRSFVGIDNLPVLYNMTIGELANYFNGKLNNPAELKVIPMQNYDRHKFWDKLDLPWRDPSPNIVNYQTALLYPMTVFFEGTNISEGRGTYTPFNIIGAPFVKGEKLDSAITLYLGDVFDTRVIDFVPVDVEDKAVNPKFEDDICFGIQLVLKDRNNYKPVEAAIILLTIFHELYPDKFEMTSYMDLLWGTDKVRKSILAGESPQDIIDSWKTGLDKFNEARKKYLLY